MANIELVIKISENDLQSIGKKVFTVWEMFETVQGRVYCAIVKGTQLLKGHGDLIDKNELLTVTDYMEDGTERCYVPYVHIKEAETIIEADRSEEKMKREEAIDILKNPNEEHHSSDGTVGYTFYPNRKNYTDIQ